MFRASLGEAATQQLAPEDLAEDQIAADAGGRGRPAHLAAVVVEDRLLLGGAAQVDPDDSRRRPDLVADRVLEVPPGVRVDGDQECAVVGVEPGQVVGHAVHGEGRGRLVQSPARCDAKPVDLSAGARGHVDPVHEAFGACGVGDAVDELSSLPGHGPRSTAPQALGVPAPACEVDHLRGSVAEQALTQHAERRRWRIGDPHVAARGRRQVVGVGEDRRLLQALDEDQAGRLDAEHLDADRPIPRFRLPDAADGRRGVLLVVVVDDVEQPRSRVLAAPARLSGGGRRLDQRDSVGMERAVVPACQGESFRRDGLSGLRERDRVDPILVRRMLDVARGDEQPVRSLRSVDHQVLGPGDPGEVPAGPVLDHGALGRAAGAGHGQDRRESAPRQQPEIPRHVWTDGRCQMPSRHARTSIDYEKSIRRRGPAGAGWAPEGRSECARPALRGAVGGGTSA